jgi:SAM domain (Sterile alpha motif)
VPPTGRVRRRGGSQRPISYFIRRIVLSPWENRWRIRRVQGAIRGPSSLGLGQYETTFRGNEINEKVLPKLTAERVGVNVLGHRRTLLDSIATLRGGSNVNVPASQHVQHKGALESDRGRHAETPWQIPWKSWKDILRRTYERIGEHRLLAVAAGVVFYGLLAVFPALTALVSLYGLFASASAISDQL